MKKTKIRKIIEKYARDAYESIPKGKDSANCMVYKRIIKKKESIPKAGFDDLEKELQEYMDEMLLWATDEKI